MKIDIFTHTIPEKWWAAVCKKYNELSIERSLPLDIKLRAMERTPDVCEILTLAPLPPLEAIVTPEDQVEFCQIANDEMAELVYKYPDKFLGAVACLPLKDMDAALKETDRAITKLRFKGVLVVPSLLGDQLDEPKYRPLYEKMAKYDLPIWIHPCTSPGYTKGKMPNILEAPPYHMGSWPLATTNCMLHLVFSGIFNDYPDIKFITHHCGGVLPMLEGRVKYLSDQGLEPEHPARKWKGHLRKFYNDTATMGTTSALMCGYDYFGMEHLLFGTDGLTLETIKSVERMNIPEDAKEKIFSQNAIDLLHLRI